MHKLHVTSPPDLCVCMCIRVYGCEGVWMYIYRNTYIYSDTLHTSSTTPLYQIFVYACVFVLMERM